jgi:hypothetical protein
MRATHKGQQRSLTGWLTKLAAGRPKDFEFCRALVRARLITPDIVRTRTPTIDPRVDANELIDRVERLLQEHESM